jgi:hypothetical protein
LASSKKPHEVKRRLKRVVTKFVSLVDAPANETEFAIYKRKEGTATAEAKPVSSGVVSGQIRKEAAMPKPQAKKTNKGLPEGTWGAQNAIKSAMSWLGSIAGIGGDPWDMTGLAAGTVDKIKAIVTDLSAIVGYPQAIDTTNKSVDGAEKALVATLATVRKELESIGAITEPIAPVEKKGAKIAQARLKKLQAAVDALNEVLKEAGIEAEASTAKKFIADHFAVELTVEETAKDQDSGESTDTPATDPVAGDAPANDAGDSTGGASDEPAADSDTAAADAGTPVASEVQKSLDSITKMLTGIQTTQKQQGDRLAQLEELRGMPQADDGGDAGAVAPTSAEVNKRHNLTSFGNAIGLRQ